MKEKVDFVTAGTKPGNIGEVKIISACRHLNGIYPESLTDSESGSMLADGRISLTGKRVDVAFLFVFYGMKANIPCWKWAFFFGGYESKQIVWLQRRVPKAGLQAGLSSDRAN